MIHVKGDDGSDGNGGTSRNNACATLQRALSASNSTRNEIWVADGTYKPDDCTSCGSGDRTSTFTIPDSVGVYGGFQGVSTDGDRKADRKVSGGTVTATWTCVQHLDPNGPIFDQTNTDLNPRFKNAASDDYELDPVDCGNSSCDSSGIDQSNDNGCDTACLTGDVKHRSREVNLDQRTYQIDKGALETQSSS